MASPEDGRKAGSGGSDVRVSADPLAAALCYAGRGLAVLPIHCPDGGGCSCSKEGCDRAAKHPRTARGSTDATADAATIRGWWARWPGANVAIATGAGRGVFMVGPDGSGGLEDLATLEAEHGPLPATWRARSGGKDPGKHFYFRWPAGRVVRNRRNHRGLKIDVRGEGGFAVAPPSRHASGNAYAWEVAPWECSVAEAPGWLVDWCEPERPDAPAEPGPGRGLWALRTTAGASPADRVIAYLEKCPPAVSGEGGHATTFRVARAVVYGFALGPELGFRLLREHYNPRCVPPWSDKELWHKCQDADARPCNHPRGWLLGDGVRAPVSRVTGGGRCVGASRHVGVKAPGRLPPAFVPFPLAAMPDVLRDLVSAGAAAIGCDPALIAPHALAAAAGCIGNSRALRLKRGWVEPCVLWALTVADSGQLKTPGWRQAVDPLMELQVELFEEHRRQMEEHRRELEQWQATPRDERGERPRPPAEPPSIVTSDATIEALGQLLAANPHGLLLATDELDTWFQSFCRYRKHGGSDRGQWLQLHGAATLRIDRLTREPRTLIVPRAGVSICGTIQPAVLAAALDEQALHAGTGARLLLAMPPDRRRRWSEAEVAEGLVERYQLLFRELLGLPLADERRRRPHVLNLSAGAKRLWVDFYNEWGRVQFQAEGEQRAAFAKMEGYASRLALLHHVVSLAAAGVSDLLDVTEASMSAGIELARWFAAEAVRVYATLAETEAERATRRLVEYIRSRGGSVTVRELQRCNSRRWPDAATAEADLAALAAAGLAEWEGPTPGPQGGQPARRLRLLCPTPDSTDTTAPAEERSMPDSTTDRTAAGPEKCGETPGSVGRRAGTNGQAAEEALPGAPEGRPGGCVGRGRDGAPRRGPGDPGRTPFEEES
jgi:hypothetical protein